MPPLLSRRVLSGLFLLDKPKGPTSHDAVLWARRVLNTPDVGHCGSLDPLATGLLLLVVGEARTQQNRFMSERKVYEGTVRLGGATDTDDTDGRPLSETFARSAADISEIEARTALAGFKGVFDQTVPTFSAVKVNGKPLYHWARKGVPVEKPTKSVEVFAIDFLSYRPPEIDFRVDCAKGFYVRALARDVGIKLGTGGVLSRLCRESIGSYERRNAYPWADRAPLDPAVFERSFIPIERLPD